MWKIAQPTPENQNNIPDNLVLWPAFPNPFNPVTTIKFGLPHYGKVRLQVFDINGHLVISLINKYLEEGYHQVKWKGLNSDGLPVSSGLYIYKLEFDNIALEKKMFLLK